MSKHLIFLTIPALRNSDLAHMPNLRRLFENGETRRIHHSFPAVTWPSQAAVLTGKLPDQTGVTANGFYWRQNHQVEMWTAWNEVIQAPQLWDSLREIAPTLTSLAWFPMLSKGCSADYVCMPAPIHQPDGSEDLWCHTKPQEFYGELLEQFEHFPLKHFWGPLANIRATQWIADSAVAATKKFHPNFLYVYFPHLDYAAQKDGPDSPAALKAVTELDDLIGQFASNIQSAIPEQPIDWMVASEYTITAVDHVTYPNRILREAGLLSVTQTELGELIDFEKSAAWALVDHQFSHVYVKDAVSNVIEQITQLFNNVDGIAEIYTMQERQKIGMDHERAGEIILLSTKNSWQAYYWWNDDNLAPKFARTVDIHQKPGYDPVELHIDMATKSIPLDATLIKGSHGLPSSDEDQKGVFLSTMTLDAPQEVSDTKLYEIVLEHFRD
ncbi:alkaline phosphatase family protein [bacterium]|nr:alkaline phosphatase family protein [bacterium]